MCKARPVTLKPRYSVCLLGAVCTLLACGDADSVEVPPKAPEASALLPRAKPVVTTQAVNPNPLDLPARKLDLAPGTVVYAVPVAMLRGAKLGSAFQLRATTVAGKDRDFLLIDGGEDPDYPLHPSYLVVHQPGARTPRLNQPVITSFAGLLRHGVVKGMSKNKVNVRLTDTPQHGDRLLDAEQLMAQSDGFAPGNYVAWRTGEGYEHMLLVSPVAGEGKDATEWLALGYGGASAIVKTADLVLIPVTYEPKVGTTVWAEHLGKMRRGVVSDFNKPAVFSVKFERAGAAASVGWGGLMPPFVPANAPPPKGPRR